jgi:serine/threonine-protein kinase
MEPGPSFTQFMQGIRDSGALSPGQLWDLERLLPLGLPDVHVAAKALLERGWMTPYQINQIYRGRAGHLVLGSYLVLERLGQGAMGEVFKARHRRLGRLAALKVIRSQRVADPRYRARFEREVQAAARLDHPHVAHAFDAGHHGDALFLAMEYIDGTDLQCLVAREGPLPVGRACEYARHAALGLQHAHDRGVLHRDVKPPNLLLASAGTVVKVLDFGLARLADNTNRAALTARGAVLGTPDYLPPEQIRDPRRADERSDLYGLGCTLYFLLTGHPPFPRGSPLQRMLAHLREEPRPVDKARPGLPAGLTGLVSVLMAKRPRDRPQTAAEVARALGALLKQGFPEPHTPGRGEGSASRPGDSTVPP